MTANGYFNIILKAFESEKFDFANYVKRNLVGFVSDGEPVMSGKHGGLVSYLQKYADNSIYSVHCMAHRLELAIVHSFETVPYFSDFEKVINELFKFYNLNSSKKKAHLKDTAKKLGKKMYALNYIYHIRWISSELQSITNLKKMWHVLVNDLNSISENSNFDKKNHPIGQNIT